MPLRTAGSFSRIFFFIPLTGRRQRLFRQICAILFYLEYSSSFPPLSYAGPETGSSGKLTCRWDSASFFFLDIEKIIVMYIVSLGYWIFPDAAKLKWRSCINRISAKIFEKILWGSRRRTANAYMRLENQTFEKRFRFFEDFQHRSPLNFSKRFVQGPIGTASKIIELTSASIYGIIRTSKDSVPEFLAMHIFAAKSRRCLMWRRDMAEGLEADLW